MDESYLLSPAIPSDLTDKKNKKRDKVRSAWIGFVGRIVAQFVGAAASILLALMFVQKYQTPRRPVRRRASEWPGQHPAQQPCA